MTEAEKRYAIKLLRQLTDHSFINCRQALEATGYDIEKAKNYLREKYPSQFKLVNEKPS